MLMTVCSVHTARSHHTVSAQLGVHLQANSAQQGVAGAAGVAAPAEYSSLRAPPPGCSANFQLPY